MDSQRVTCDWATKHSTAPICKMDIKTLMSCGYHRAWMNSPSLIKATDSTWYVAEFILIFIFYILVTHQGQPSSLHVKKWMLPTDCDRSLKLGLPSEAFPRVHNSASPERIFCQKTVSRNAQPCPTLCSLWFGARWTPLSMEFSRQECQNGLPFPSPGDLSDLRTEPTTSASHALAGRFLTVGHSIISRKK